MNDRDFTLRKYRQLCSALLDHEYRIVRMDDYFGNREKREPKTAMLRHDVDRNPRNAVRMAELESRLGVCSTYYFRMIRSVFQPHLLRRVAALGHEVGYHYETLSKMKGNHDRAIKLFKFELSKLNKITNIKTICMHGSPLSKYDNRRLWEKYSYQDLGITGDAYLSLDDPALTYFTDTGRSWNAGRSNLRDRFSSSNRYEIQSTNELIQLIRNENVYPLLIQTHPERWNEDLFLWYGSYVFDQLANVIKRVLSMRAH